MTRTYKKYLPSMNSRWYKKILTSTGAYWVTRRDGVKHLIHREYSQGASVVYNWNVGTKSSPKFKTFTEYHVRYYYLKTKTKTVKYKKYQKPSGDSKRRPNQSYARAIMTYDTTSTYKTKFTPIYIGLIDVNVWSEDIVQWCLDYIPGISHRDKPNSADPWWVTAIGGYPDSIEDQTLTVDNTYIKDEDRWCRTINCSYFIGLLGGRPCPKGYESWYHFFDEEILDFPGTWTSDALNEIEFAGSLPSELKSVTDSLCHIKEIHRPIGFESKTLTDILSYKPDRAISLEEVGLGKALRLGMKSPYRGAIQLLTFLGELPESVRMFITLTTGIIRSCRKLKHGNINGAYQEILKMLSVTRKKSQLTDIAAASVNASLLFKFGISPLVGELQTLYEFFLKGDFDLTDLDGSKRITRRFRFPDEKYPFESEFDHVVELELAPGNIAYKTSAFKLTGETTLCSGYDILIKDQKRFLVEAFGLNNPIGTLWELFPYSFVIDWFVDIGSFIEKHLAVDLNSFSIDDPYVTTVTRGTFSETLKTLEFPGLVIPEKMPACINTGKFFIMRRFRLKDLPIPGNLAEIASRTERFDSRDTLTPSRGVTAAQLIAQKLL